MRYKYALVNGQRQEAQPGSSGKCQECDAPMAAKCGKINIWHWAHLGGQSCDPWWENETKWHRAWKGQFPDAWQEVVHKADTGEKHIADVKTDQGWVLEFQHSPIAPEERQSRNNFYQQIVWVVDGTSRKRDEAQFFKSLNKGVQIIPNVALQKLRGLLDECALLREWGGSDKPVFFDFGEQKHLVYLLPKTPDGDSYVMPLPRAQFINFFRGGVQTVQFLDFFFKEILELVSDYNARLRAQSSNQAIPLPKFQQHSARMARSRRSF